MTHWISSGGANYIGVRNVAATAWYVEKLGLRKVNIEMDNGEGCIALGFSKDEYAVNLGPPGRPTEELTPMLYSPNVKKAREFLSTALTEGDHVGGERGDAFDSATGHGRELRGVSAGIGEGIGD